MEHRTADTLTRLNNAERLLKDQRQLAYEVRSEQRTVSRRRLRPHAVQDPAKAEEERELGNKFFKQDKVCAAVRAQPTDDKGQRN